MPDKVCPLLDFVPKGEGRPRTPICYANGRLLGQKYLTDYCSNGSNLGHEACPIIRLSNSSTLSTTAVGAARQHYKRLSEK